MSNFLGTKIGSINSSSYEPGGVDELHHKKQKEAQLITVKSTLPSVFISLPGVLPNFLNNPQAYDDGYIQLRSYSFPPFTGNITNPTSLFITSEICLGSILPNGGGVYFDPIVPFIQQEPSAGNAYLYDSHYQNPAYQNSAVQIRIDQKPNYKDLGLLDEPLLINQKKELFWGQQIIHSMNQHAVTLLMDYLTGNPLNDEQKCFLEIMNQFQFALDDGYRIYLRPRTSRLYTPAVAGGAEGLTILAWAGANQAEYALASFRMLIQLQGNNPDETEKMGRLLGMNKNHPTNAAAVAVGEPYFMWEFAADYNVMSPLILEFLNRIDATPIYTASFPMQIPRYRRIRVLTTTTTNSWTHEGQKNQILDILTVPSVSEGNTEIYMPAERTYQIRDSLTSLRSIQLQFIDDDTGLPCQFDDNYRVNLCIFFK